MTAPSWVDPPETATCGECDGDLSVWTDEHGDVEYASCHGCRYRFAAAAQLKVLQDEVAKAKPRERVQHPRPGCPCADCTERDTRLEDKAERRAEDRAGGVRPEPHIRVAS